jgi:hypothetical protein
MCEQPVRKDLDPSNEHVNFQPKPMQPADGNAHQILLLKK